MGTLTCIVPFESTVTASSPAQLFVHGPVTDGAHSTVATLPDARLLHTNTPFPLKEVMTGAAAWYSAAGLELKWGGSWGVIAREGLTRDPSIA